MKDIEALKIALGNGKVKKPWTRHIIDGLKICLLTIVLNLIKIICCRQMTQQPGSQISAPSKILKFTKWINW